VVVVLSGGDVRSFTSGVGVGVGVVVGSALGGGRRGDVVGVVAVVVRVSDWLSSPRAIARGVFVVDGSGWSTATQLVRSTPCRSARPGMRLGDCGGQPGADACEVRRGSPPSASDGQQLLLRGVQRDQTVDMLGGLNRSREMPGQACRGQVDAHAVFPPHGDNRSSRAARQASA
jgi:hypothetical protein